MMKRLSSVSLLITALCAVGFFIGAVWIYTVDSGTIEPAWFRAAMAVLSGISLGLPRLLFFLTPAEKFLSYPALLLLEMGWLVMIVLNAFGALSFYTSTQYYDMVLHIIDPMIGAAMIAVLVSAHQLEYGTYTLRRTLLRTALFTSVVILCWEFYEYVVDFFLGTKMFGQTGEYLDTVFDIGGGFTGLFIALLFLRSFLEKCFLQKRTDLLQ